MRPPSTTLHPQPIAGDESSRALARTDHRPWPLPERPWRWRQTWHDLLFAHWPVPAAQLRAFVPAALEIDEFDGMSWVGLVPFRMTGVTLRGWPDVPGISAFAEMNLRLYVSHRGRSGVWFVSLDAAHRLAVLAARTFVHLPYFHAAMRCEPDGDAIHYASRRLHGEPRVELRARYAPTGPVREAVRGSLEHFLTERYCLFALSPGRGLLRLEVQHGPWPLQPAEVMFEINRVAGPQGIALPDEAPILHFSRRLDVVGWGAENAI